MRAAKLSVAILAPLLVASAKNTAHIGLMLPYTNKGSLLAGDLFWKQMHCAAIIAVSHVNSKFEGIVPGLAALTSNLETLNGSTYDTGYSASPAIVSYRQMRADGAVAMVAAARSAVSMPLAQLGEIDHMPQCSYWSSSPSLSDAQLYPYCAPRFACLAVALTHLNRPHPTLPFCHLCNPPSCSLRPALCDAQSAAPFRRTPSRPRCCLS